jgi:uncharacterized membrane protein
MPATSENLTGARPASEGAPRRPRPETLVVLVAMVAFATCFSAVSLHRHWGLNSSGLDLAMQDQVLWTTARGRWFQTSIEVGNFLGDHVAPIALLLAPITRLPGLGVEWLLILQATAIAVAAWPLQRLARRETGSPIWAVALPLAFLLQPALGFMSRFDFHLVTLCIPCLAWLVWSLRAGRIGTATAAAILAIACREEVALAVAGIAIHAAFQRRWRWWGIITACLAVTWAALAVLWIIPYFRGGPADTLARYAWLGDSPATILTALITRPVTVLAHLLGDPIRLKTLAYLLWPLLLLPILAPARLACALVPLAICLLPDHASQNSIYFHYVAPVLPAVAWAAVGGAARVERWLGTVPGNVRRMVPVMLVASAAAAFAVENPVTRTVRAPYWHVQVGPPRPNVAAFRDALTHVSPDDAVLSTMALAPHLSRRTHLGIVGWQARMPQPDVILLDVSDFRWFGRLPGYAEALARLVQARGYGVQFFRDDLVLLRRDAAHAVDPADVLKRLAHHARAARAAPGDR